MFPEKQSIGIIFQRINHHFLKVQVWIHTMVRLIIHPLKTKCKKENQTPNFREKKSVFEFTIHLTPADVVTASFSGDRSVVVALPRSGVPQSRFTKWLRVMEPLEWTWKGKWFPKVERGSQFPSKNIIIFSRPEPQFLLISSFTLPNSWKWKLRNHHFFF